MKALTKYSKNGYNFQLLKRIGSYAIFKGISKLNTARSWEVIEIQSHNGREINGQKIEASEYAPSNNQWGAKGWTFQTLENTTDKLFSLTAKNEGETK